MQLLLPARGGQPGTCKFYRRRFCPDCGDDISELSRAGVRGSVEAVDRGLSNRFTPGRDLADYLRDTAVELRESSIKRGHDELPKYIGESYDAGRAKLDRDLLDTTGLPLRDWVGWGKAVLSVGFGLAFWIAIALTVNCFKGWK